MQEKIRDAQQGDRHAFEWLLNQHYDRMFRFALKWCGNHTDAEDITQQACIKLAKGIVQYQFEAAFTTWLYRLVINCAKDWQKSQQRHQQCSLDEYTEEPEQQLANQHSSAGEPLVYLHQILLQVNNMGEGFKETVLLVLGEGLSHKEAANILNIEEGTVSWRIHKIRQHLSQEATSVDTTRHITLDDKKEGTGHA